MIDLQELAFAVFVEMVLAAWKVQATAALSAHLIDECLHLISQILIGVGVDVMVCHYDGWLLGSIGDRLWLNDLVQGSAF